MKRVPIVLAAAAFAVGGAWLIGRAVADDPHVAPVIADAPHPLTLAVTAGRHLRIDGPRGPVHVWIPPGYRAETGANIIYVHGYFDDADTAWIGHQLPEQFAMSALNALFIVPEAPVAQKLPINYPDLGELLRLVEDKAQVSRGQALTVAVGHSGAFRTLQTWLNEPLLDQLVMVDAMYGDEDLILDWYRSSPRHRLIMVGEDTLLGTESVNNKISDGLVLDRFPPTYDTWPAEAHTQRLVYIRAQYAHMPLVMEGIVLPSLLRLLPVELLADAPWKQPLGALPPMPDAPAASAD